MICVTRDKPNNKDLPEFENLFSEKSKISIRKMGDIPNSCIRIEIVVQQAAIIYTYTFFFFFFSFLIYTPNIDTSFHSSNIGIKYFMQLLHKIFVFNLFTMQTLLFHLISFQSCSIDKNVLKNHPHNLNYTFYV